jgi:hypothetical protein
LQAAIKDKYGITATLKEGMAGIFRVSIGNKVVYTNETTYAFPTNAEIFEQIEAAKKT